MDRESLLEQTREVFRDARDAFRAALEDEIETETRAVYPAAVDLGVEVYTNEFGESRGRLIAINPDGGSTEEQQGAVAERTAHLLDEWATTANADSTEIVFRPLPE